MNIAMRRGPARAWTAAVAMLFWSVAAFGAPWLLPQPDLDLRSAGAVSHVLPLPDGGAIVAGRFRQVNGVPRLLGLTKLHPDGSLDVEWNPTGFPLDEVEDLVLDDAGFVFVAGTRFVGATTVARVFKFSSSGAGAVPADWHSLQYATNTYVSALELDGAGHLYIAGSLSKPGFGDPAIRRASAVTGVLDPDWMAQSAEPINALAFGADNRLYLARRDTFSALGSLRRLDPALGGELDPDWNPPLLTGSVAEGIFLGADGFVYARGFLDFFQGGQHYLRRVARIASSPDASLDTNWLSAQPDAKVTGMAATGDGQLLLSGDFAGVGGLDRPLLARVSTTDAGTVDPDWPPLDDVSGTVDAVAPFGEDVLIGGWFHAVDDQPMLGLARVAANAVHPIADAENPGGLIRAIAEEADGSLLVGGRFHKIGNLDRQGLARLRSTGNVDSAWSAQVDGEVTSLALADGRVYVGGSFRAIDGVPRTGLARLQGDGQLDADWAPILTPASGTSQPYLLQLLADDQGQLYAVGQFSSIDGIARSNLVRFDLAAGALDTDWAPPIHSVPQALAVTGEHVVLAASVFPGPSYLFRVFRGGSGAVDMSWTPGVNGTVFTMHVAADGHLYISGQFDSIGGVPRVLLARFQPTPALELDPDWQPLTAHPLYAARAMTTGNDGYLYVGGNALNTPQGRVLRFSTSGAGAADPGFDRFLNRPVYALASAVSNRLLVGGAFTNIGLGLEVMQRRGLAAYAVDELLFADGFDSP